MSIPCSLGMVLDPCFAPMQVGGLFHWAVAATGATWFAGPVWHLFQETSGSCCFFPVLASFFNGLWMIPLRPAWQTERRSLQQMLKVHPPKSVSSVLKSTSKHPVLGITLKNFVARFGWLVQSCARGRVTVCVSEWPKALLWPFRFRVSVWPHHVRIQLPQSISSLLCSQNCPQCVASSIKAVGRLVEGIPLCSVLSSTAPLLTPGSSQLRTDGFLHLLLALSAAIVHFLERFSSWESFQRVCLARSKDMSPTCHCQAAFNG